MRRLWVELFNSVDVLVLPTTPVVAPYRGEGEIRWPDGAVEAVTELGGARPGDRTMVDALRPAADTFAQALQRGTSPAGAWAEAVRAAEAGAESTARMKPRLGRASYLGERAVGLPDAGAQAVVVWLRALTPFIG